jgi:two-component system LytT family response regulator
MRGQIRIIPVERIDFIMASGPYVELHVGMEKYLVSEQMQTLEERLDPAHFFRIHRSAIVRLDRIETLLVHAGGDYLACLANNQRLKVSRRRWDDLVDRLGIEFQRKRGDAE